MRKFLWKIAGGDCQILEKSGTESQNSFWIIGILYLFVNLIIVVSFLGMFLGIFDDFLLSIIGTCVLGFLISNIYKLNLLSLEPYTLPIKIETGSVVFTHIIRYTTVIAFAFFVSKCFEMVIILGFESTGVLRNISGSEGYMMHLFRVNREYPIVWFITFFVMLLFILPIYLRHRLNKAKEYYSLKERRDIRLVIEHHEQFLKIKENIYIEIYSSYEKFRIIKIYQTPKKKYTDEPFNTKENVVDRNLKSSEDFLEAILNKS